MPGLFVTFEGGEGSGKTTQLERLAERLRKHGSIPLVTREPGGTPVAERVRELLLDPSRTPNELAEAFLLEAARAELLMSVIRPALEAGRVVLCDRYADSTLAYQGAGRGLDLALLEIMNRAATGGLTPDLTLLFDLDPAIGIERRAQAPGTLSRLDREPLEFHRRVRDKFLELAGREPQRFVVLDATVPPELIERRVWSEVEGRLREGVSGQQPKSGPRVRP